MKYKVEIVIRRYRFGPDYHCEFFDTYQEAKNYIECIKRDQPRLMYYTLTKEN